MINGIKNVFMIVYLYRCQRQCLVVSDEDTQDLTSVVSGLEEVTIFPTSDGVLEV